MPINECYINHRHLKQCYVQSVVNPLFRLKFSLPVPSRAGLLTFILLWGVFFLRHLWRTVLLGTLVEAGICGLSEVVDHLCRPPGFQRLHWKLRCYLIGVPLQMTWSLFLLQLLISFPCSEQLVFGLLHVFIRILSRPGAAWKRRRKDSKCQGGWMTPGKQHLPNMTLL